MTIIQAITAADGLRNNAVNGEIKRAMLSELDGRIFYEIIQPYGDAGEFVGYTDQTPSDTELLVPHPYDSLYKAYLEQEIARISGEMARYNNVRIVFNERLEAFRRWYVRTHTPHTPRITFPTRR